MGVVLDSWAVLRFLEGTEPAATADHTMAYAAAFGAALAVDEDAELWTGGAW